MNARLEHRWPPPLPDLFEWIESGLPSVPGIRTAPGLHGIRIEEQVTDGTYVLSAELPGVDPEREVEIGLEGDVLTVRAERGEKAEGKRHSEFRYGAFARSVRLPAGARGDEATADYEDGILTVRIPISPKETEPHTVTVRRASREP